LTCTLSSDDNTHFQITLEYICQFLHDVNDHTIVLCWSDLCT